MRVLFWCLNLYPQYFQEPDLFYCAYFINFRFNVCVLAAVIIGIRSTWYFKDLFSYHVWKQLFTQKCAINYQTNLEKRLNNLWTWNNRLLMKYYTGDSAEWIRIIWAQFGGQSGVFDTETYCIKPFPKTLLPSDHNSNLKWTILGT
jgi:hypothetical protein